MSVNLAKGEKIDLTKERPSLKKVYAGLGWDVNQYNTGADFDLDASAFLVGENGRVNNDSDFVFYGNMQHPSQAVCHTGDNRTGAGEGDDEQIMIDLEKVPEWCERIAFTVTIYNAEKYNQNFGQVKNAYIRIVDEATDEEIVRYDLEEDFSAETALVVGELYRKNGGWSFNAIGSGFNGGLAALCQHFGIDAKAEH